MPGVIILPGSVASGTLVYEWVDPAGVARALSGNDNVNVTPGERGLGVPAIDLAEDKLPFSPGGVIRHAATASREIELPLLFGPMVSSAALEEVMDDVYGWFATADETTRTPGFLRVTRRDGTQRQIRCFYAGGLEGDLDGDRAGETWQEATVLLKAADPWATDVDDTVLTYDQDDLGDDLTILNTGQLDAYPIWTITGPGSAITITNTTTNQSFALTAAGGLTLGAGDVLTIDTRPTSQRTDLPVLDQDGTSQFSKLAVPTSVLWHFPSGVSHVELSITGADGDTEIELRYLARYRGLLR